jgi:heterodisulfide reductase subunit C2
VLTLDPKLADAVAASTTYATFDAAACMNCGVCTAICPVGTELLPRRLFHLVLLGATETLRAEVETVYSCLLCKLCEDNCPAGVHITENLRVLRNYCNRTVFGI